MSAALSVDDMSPIDYSDVKTIPPSGFSVVILGVLIPLTILAALAVGARLAVRTRRKILAVEDALLLAGFIILLAHNGILFWGAFVGVGVTPKVYETLSVANLTAAQGAIQYCGALYFVAQPVLKISICATLLRVAATKLWARCLLWVVIVIVAVNGIFLLSALVTICQPFSSLWKQIAEDCQHPTPLKIYNAFNLFFPCFNIASDLLIAVMPAILLWNLHKGKQQKIGIVLLLSSGALASVGPIVLVAESGIPVTLITIIKGSQPFWQSIECLVASTAASLPALSSLVLPAFWRGSRPTPANQSPMSHSFRTIGHRQVRRTPSDTAIINDYDSDSDRDNLDGIRLAAMGDSDKASVKSTSNIVVNAVSYRRGG